MPRVMLRYAIEKLDKPRRDAWQREEAGVGGGGGV